MTPDFESRRLEAKDAIAGTLPGDQIRALVARERIRYVVTTAEAAPRLIEALHPVRVHGSAPPSVILQLGDISGSERK